MHEPNPANLPIGGVFGERYEIVRPIQSGGMGAVYEVIDRRNLRRRALKVMLPRLLSEQHLRERFEREATVTAAIESEHIVEVLDAGVDAETAMPFLAMELLRGEDLATRLARTGRLPAVEVVELLGQAAMALERTHAAGVVHRDLKPENLFLTVRDDGSPRLKILDFGIAKLVTPTDAGKTTGNPGTPLYMAPEQLRADRDIGPPCDLYALGLIAYTLLVGVEYWGEELEGGVYPLLVKLLAGVTEPATTRAARRSVVLPAAFDAWFEAVTSIEVARRPAGAYAVVAGLAAALAVEAPAQASTLGSAGSAPRVDPTARTMEATPALNALPRATSGGARPALTPSVPPLRLAAEAAPASIVLPMSRPLVPVAAGVAVLVAALVAVLVGRSGAAARPATTAAPTADEGRAPSRAPEATTSAAPVVVVDNGVGSAAPVTDDDASARAVTGPQPPRAPSPTPAVRPVERPREVAAPAPGPQPRRRAVSADDPGF